MGLSFSMNVNMTTTVIQLIQKGGPMLLNPYADEFINCFNHILEYRNYEKKLLENDPEFIGIVDKTNLKKSLERKEEKEGNVAVCSLIKDEQVVSNCYIAGSIHSWQTLREIQFESYITDSTTPSRIAVLIGRRDEDNLRHGYNDPILVLLPYPESESYVIHPYYGGKENRLHDSERILINVFQHIINNKCIDFDTVLMVTERIPCKSCTNIILEFVNKNDVKIKLAYWIDTGRKDELRDFEVLKKQINKDKKAMKNIEVCEIILKADNMLYLIDRELD